MQYLGRAALGKPYMGIGRNLSYSRELFFRKKGFAKHLHVISGDDDLLVNAWANKENTEICLHPESFVYSSAKKGFSEWMNQKKRHLYSGKFYKKSARNTLFIYWLFAVLAYLSSIFPVILKPEYYLSYLPLAVFILIRFLFISLLASRFKVMHLLAFLIPLDIIYQFIYTPLLSLLVLFKKRMNVWS